MNMHRTRPSPSLVRRGSTDVDDGRLPTTADRPSYGCQQDFQSIHDAFRPRILRYLARLAGQSEAEDLTQTVLFRISEGLPHFRGESSLSTWIYRIATNTALDHLRRSKNDATNEPQRPQNQTNDEHGFEEGGASLEGRTPSVETVMIRAEMNTCIRDFIERLPENYKTVMVLSELEGFKNGEIAAVLGLSLDT
ncbi:MAG TPA: sigma-70 family RNA polymerase sigma factor, partial [Burkholderiaceae bacterium]|nr:sigma-70 family RNA polymerase sigma factor [Burkholderiaceae bacterium]